MDRRRMSSVLVVVIVFVSAFGGLIVVPIGPAGSARAMAWVQTTQSDFGSAAGEWNVDTGSSPGNVTLVSSPDSWVKGGSSPVFDVGSPGSWDSEDVNNPSVLLEGDGFKMWYEGDDNSVDRIGFATSADGKNWTRNPVPVLAPGPGAWDSASVILPFVIKERGLYEMWYGGIQAGDIWQIGYANSSDGTSWKKYPANPVMTMGPPGTWDGTDVHSPSVIWDASVSKYKMWYTGSDGTYERIGYAESQDGLAWSYRSPSAVLDLGPRDTWDDAQVRSPSVVKEGATFRMWYTGFDGSKYRIGYATSADGVNWTKSPLNPILEPGAAPLWDSVEIGGSHVLNIEQAHKMWYNGWDGTHARIGVATAAYSTRFMKESSNPVLELGSAGSWDASGIMVGTVLRVGSEFQMWYHGIDGGVPRIGFATSYDGFVWMKPILGLFSYGGHSSNNLVMVPDVPWEQCAVSSPSVMWNGSGYQMWYSGNNCGSWSIGYATSMDGVHWMKYPLNPVLVPSPETNVFAPSVLFVNGMYEMWYTGPDGADDKIRYAESFDGVSWTKLGTVLDGGPSAWDAGEVFLPYVLVLNGTYKMWYTGIDAIDSLTNKIGYAESTDGTNWAKLPGTPVLVPTSGNWDGFLVSGGAVWSDGVQYRMWYNGYRTNLNEGRIGHAVSTNGINWTKRAVNPVLSEGGDGEWDDYTIHAPKVIRDNQTFSMWYSSMKAVDLWHWKIGYARSDDGNDWSKWPTYVLSSEAANPWESSGVHRPHVIKMNNTLKMWYTGESSWSGTTMRIGYAESNDGVNWTRLSANPVLGPGDPGSWDGVATFAPAVIFRDGSYHMWYTGRGSGGASQDAIGYAVSNDGVNWSRNTGNPVLAYSPEDWWPSGGIELYDVIESAGIYVMSFGQHGAGLGLGIAISVDGISWIRSKLNPILVKGISGRWDYSGLNQATLLEVSGKMGLWYGGWSGSGNWQERAGHATTSNWGLGTLESSVFDSGGAGTIWETISWNATLPPNTVLMFTARSGDTPTPDSTWSDWMTETMVPGSPLTLPRSRYIQYRVTLVSMDSADTPIVEDVTILYSLNQADTPTLDYPYDNSWIATKTTTFRWTFHDSNPFDSQTAFHVEIDHEISFASVDYTSGIIFSSDEYWPISTQMADGCWYWHVRTRDNFGIWSSFSGTWKFCVDTTPPRTALQFGSPTYVSGPTTYVTSATLLTLAASDTGGIGVNRTMHRTWNGTSWSPGSRYTSPFTLTGADGLRSIEYYSVDHLGNTEAVDNTTVFLDNTPPSTSIVVGAPQLIVEGNYYVASSTPFSLPASDAGSGVNSTFYRVNLGTPVRYTAPFDLTGFSGLNTMSFYSADNLGNIERTAALTVFVDTKPPHTSLSVGQPRFGADPVFVRSSTEFNLTAAEDVTAVDSIWYRVDADAWTLFTVPFTMPSQGPHTVSYNSTDLMGNSESPSSLSVYIDDSPPATTLSYYGSTYAPGMTTYIGGGTLILLTSSDLGSGVSRTEFRFDSGPWMPYTGPLAMAMPGMHLFEYRSLDNIGNTEATTSTDIYLDSSPPTTSVNVGSPKYGAAPVYISPSTAIDITASDADTPVAFTWYRVDGGSWQTYGGPFAIAAPGYHVISFNSTDSVGNAESVGYLSLFVDVNEPTTVVQYQGPSHVSGTTVYVSATTSILFAATDAETPAAETWYRMDTGVWKLYTGGFTVTTPGPHTIDYNSTDAMGNVESPRQASINVDVAVPTTSVSYIGPTYTSGGTLYLTGSTAISVIATDAGAGVSSTRCEIDSGGMAPCRGPFTINTPGQHALRYQSEDRVGNIETATTVTVFVDDSAPATMLAVGDPKVGTSPMYMNSSTVFTLSSTDEASGVSSTSYIIDDDSWMQYSTPFSLSALADGVHHISYRGVDNLGNIEETRTVVLFKDDSPPVADAGEDMSVAKGASVTFNGAASTDNSAIANYTWTFTYRGGAKTMYGPSPAFTFEDTGMYDVFLTVRDVMGYTSTDAVRVEVTVPPAVEENLGVSMTLLIPIVLLLVIVAVLLMLYLRERARRTPETETDEDEAVEEEEALEEKSEVDPGIEEEEHGEGLEEDSEIEIEDEEEEES